MSPEENKLSINMASLERGRTCFLYSACLISFLFLINGSKIILGLTIGDFMRIYFIKWKEECAD